MPQIKGKHNSAACHRHVDNKSPDSFSKGWLGQQHVFIITSRHIRQTSQFEQSLENPVRRHSDKTESIGPERLARAEKSADNPAGLNAAAPPGVACLKFSSLSKLS
jgi:hypothetical protein